MNRSTINSGEPRRVGLSRIEAVVIAGMLAVVVALIGPAVWQARQSTRQIGARNTLRWMGVAMSQYEMIHGSLPQGGSSPSPQRTKASPPAAQP